MEILERFLNYVAIDTTSDSSKEDTPSTIKQHQLAKILVQELQDLNVNQIIYDQKHCYVYAKVIGDDSLPKIGFVAHMDTSESSKGSDIKTNIFRNYDGNDLILNESLDVVLKVTENLDLKNHVGKTLITTDGTTLLGADDKAGIAEIMTMLQNITSSNMEHGDIYVCFTPDEEIGLGTMHLNMDYFNPDIAFTIDGSSLGELSYENFNAASATINVKGVVTHLGYAKDKLINAVHIATLINSLLPDEVPENSENREGYYCLKEMNGTLGEARMKYLIRDFDSNNFEKRKEILKAIVQKLNDKYGNCIDLDIKDSYYNILHIMENEPTLISNTLTALNDVNVAPLILPIMGGTDGCTISYMGIPCPNLGTGGHNFHSVYEYICLEDMIKTSELLLQIIKQFAKKQDATRLKKEYK